MRIALLEIAVLAFALASCVGPAGKVTVLQGGASVAPGAAVAWAPVQPDGVLDPRIDNSRIRAAVERALAAKGHSFVQNPAAAQYLVSYHVGLRDRQELRVDNTLAPAPVCGWRGCVGGYYWGMYGALENMRTVDYVEGTMILSLTDRAAETLTWRATAQRRLEGDDAQDGVDAAVNDMLRSLP
jgi:hypothetical protein